MSFLSTAPVNFERFLSLQRSASRSLSPEHELRQMMAPHSAAPGLTALYGPPHGGADGRVGTEATAEAHFAGTDAPAPQPGEAPPSPHSSGTRTVADEVVALASMWQYGGPLFYPVTGALYCWNGHRTVAKECGSYAEVEGVSCDFCGYTRWVAEAAGGPSAADNVFQHCDTCGVDICHRCAEDVRLNDRLHLPCLRCAACGDYAPLHAEQQHRCTPALPTIPQQKRQRRAAAAPTAEAARGSVSVSAGATSLPSRSVSTAAAAAAAAAHTTPPSAPKAAADSADGGAAVPVRPRRRARKAPAEPRPRVARRASPKRSPAMEAAAGDGEEEAPPVRRRGAVKKRARSATPPSPPVTTAPPPPSAWAVRVETPTTECVEEVQRIAVELSLEAAQRQRATRNTPPTVVFHLPTRLRAEKCAARAQTASLTAAVVKL